MIYFSNMEVSFGSLSYLLGHFNSLLLLTHVSNFLFYLTLNKYIILYSVSDTFNI